MLPTSFRLALCCGALLCAAPAPSAAVLAQSAEPIAVATSMPAELSADDWSAIRAAHARDRHAARPVDGGWEAHNPGQRFTARLDGRGVTLRSDANDWSWGLELSSWGFAGHEATVTSPTASSAAAGRVAYTWGESLEEWYVNDPRGLEHGYTVRARPSGAGEAPLVFTLTLRGGLSPEVGRDARGVRFLDANGREALTYAGLTVFDAAGERLPARMEAAGTTLRLEVDERGAAYPLTVDPLVQQAYLKSYFATANETFGSAVAVSGDTVAVGKANEVCLFVRNGSAWSQQGSVTSLDPDLADWFGFSVALDGDLLAVGASRDDSVSFGGIGDPLDNGAPDSGAVYVFTRVAGSWLPTDYLKASNGEPDDHFGERVGIRGGTLVVGAPGEDSAASGVNGNLTDNTAEDAGAAYVFTWNGATWDQEAYLKASNPGGSPGQDCVVIGPFVFCTDIPGDGFGAAVAVDGDTVLVGASHEDGGSTGVNGIEDETATDSGAAYVFTRTAGSWSQQAYLKPSNTHGESCAFIPQYFCFDDGEFFGSAVALSGDLALIGAPNEGSHSTGIDGSQVYTQTYGAGAAYLFQRTGTTWAQDAYVKASNTESGDGFGAAVAISGTTFLVGAYGEDSAATGTDGDQDDNSADFAGAAYAFSGGPGAWAQHAYIKASNTGLGDGFGDAVGVSGDTLVIGAPWEDSAATGVNGDPTDDSSSSAGAAYVRVLCTGGAASEVIRTGTPANPTALLPGQTSGPVLGQVWDPRIEHTSFLPTAALDFLSFAATPLNLPTEFGTLLCAPAIYTFVNAASTPFLLSLPPDCALVGAQLCFQGASWDGTLPLDGTTLQFTNALDVTFGM